jgi:hypothetical protein
MFTPNEIEAIPLNLEKTFRDMESRIMADIVRKLKDNGGDITRATDWQIQRLYELGKSKEEIKEEIQKALDLSDQEIDNMYDEVLPKGYARNEELYTAMGQEFISYDDNEELQQLVTAVKNQTKEQCRNITQSLGFAIKQPNGKLTFKPVAKYYQDTLDGGLMDIATGVFAYNTVLKRVVSEMTNSGLRSVDYASGWSNRIEVASRRAIMTGFNQVVAKVNEDNAEELGTEYFEVSYHGGARPSHQEWQGRVYTKEQLESVCGLGEVTGLCGANCYHSYSPFFMGLSKRNYTDEELDRMNKEENTPKEYNGKQYTKYEALQKQRRLETTMRAQRQKIKLLQEGGASEDDIIAERVKYRGTSSEYARFSKAMNLPQQRERVTVDGLGNIGVGKYKSTSNTKMPLKTVEKSSESGIMDMGSGSVALENQRYGRNKNTLVDKTYIDSGNYRRKFDNATDNSEVNKTLYDSAKKALKHRSGTIFEDMYWIDSNTGKVIFSVTDSTEERAILYTDKIKKAIRNNTNIVTLHTHPSSMPPSIDDFNSCYKNGYKEGFIACHNGKIFKYTAEQEVSKKLYDLYISDFLDAEYEEFDAQIKALEKIKENHLIDFEEVVYNG